MPKPDNTLGLRLMKLGPCLVLALLLIPQTAVAADKNKDMIDLRRDMALLSDRLRAVQSTIDQNNAATAALLRQTIDRVNQARAQNAAVETALRELNSHQQEDLAQPVASLGSKIAQVDTKVAATGNSLADLGVRLRKMDQTLADVDELVRIIQAPHPPPPSFSEALGGPPQGVTMEGLFGDAMRDQLAGQYDQAAREFRDFLKYFDRTELIAAAHFHLGEIALAQGDAKAAIQACDLILEQYPKCAKAPDARYLKARALQKAGSRSRAVQELNRVIRSYPGTEAARNAQADLRRPRR